MVFQAQIDEAVADLVDDVFALFLESLPVDIYAKMDIINILKYFFVLQSVDSSPFPSIYARSVGHLRRLLQ